MKQHEAREAQYPVEEIHGKKIPTAEGKRWVDR
jgi:hypothetical protein